MNKSEDICVTKVNISFYKPTGFSDTYWINTRDRGAAVKFVMSKYENDMLVCLNGVVADLCTPPKAPNRPVTIENLPNE